MRRRIYSAVLLAVVSAVAGVGASASAQTVPDLEQRMLGNCQVLAKQLNRSRHVGISLDGITPMVTWHAACADRPPTGPGNVTALCEGNRNTAKGKARVFFWQKSAHGKFNQAYFICSG